MSALGSRGGGPEFDPDVAAPGNSDVVRTKLEVMQQLGLRETVEDILITLDTWYHLIRPIHGNSGEKLFLYLVLNRARANPAMARLDLRVIEQQLYLAVVLPSRAPSRTTRRSTRPTPPGAELGGPAGAAGRMRWVGTATR